ncbi:MAG: DUF480 domain-containing protein [Thermoanaerobaculia bacterium]
MSAFRPSRPLDAIEIRVLGCLLEKELSTPDGYPLSLTALTAAVNQRSNRHPVLKLAGEEVDAALSRLLREMLVWRVQSARVLRWQHNLDSKWPLGDTGKAILAELLVRGAQTPGELRSRCQRMHAFAELGQVEATLSTLAGAELGLVRELPRQPGQKENRWTHLLSVEMTEAVPSPEPAPGSSPLPPASQDLEHRLARLEEVARQLTAEIAALRRELANREPSFKKK